VILAGSFISIFFLIFEIKESRNLVLFLFLVFGPFFFWHGFGASAIQGHF